MAQPLNRRNRALVARLPCLLKDTKPSDPHHYPLRRSGQAGDGLLEMVPLNHDDHRALHDGDPWTQAMVEALAPAYFRRIYLQYNGSVYYLGPAERIATVRAEVEAEVATRRRLLGV